MADHISVDVSELDAIVADLGEAAATIPGAIRRVLQKGAADVKADAQRFAPVDTGALRSSITYETHQLADGARAEIGPSVEYAPYLEYGTVHMAPHAFMGPAFDRNTPDVIAALEELSDRTLDR